MLKHGILGLLNYGDMTGYEINTAFKDSLSFFWSAQTSQIYRELDALEKKGWIKKQTEEQDKKPNKNICSITDEGRRELLRWLSEEDVAGAQVRRVPVLMKTFFMGELPLSGGLDFFKKLLEEGLERQSRIERADEFIGVYREFVPDSEKAVFWSMAAEFGRRYMRMYLEWTQYCIEIMEGME